MTVLKHIFLNTFKSFLSWIILMYFNIKTKINSLSMYFSYHIIGKNHFESLSDSYFPKPLCTNNFEPNTFLLENCVWFKNWIYKDWFVKCLFDSVFCFRYVSNVNVFLVIDDGLCVCVCVCLYPSVCLCNYLCFNTWFFWLKYMEKICEKNFKSNRSVFVYVILVMT